MPGCSTPPIGSPQGWLEAARANRSTSRKPIPPSPSVGRAAIVSTDRHSSTRITTPAGSPPFSATRPTSSVTGCKEAWLCIRSRRPCENMTNTYASYLGLERLLSAQTLQTSSDDELLLIIIHQQHELWFQLAIHELDCATRSLMKEDAHEGDCIIAFKRLSR